MFLSPYLLQWEDEHLNTHCQAQGIITNGTDAVWISCTSFVARGRIVDDYKLVIDRINYQALNHTALANYKHISDGDYVHRTGFPPELWFGIEGGNLPRVTAGAIVRYHAETLEFIDLHVHPLIKTMPFLAYDPRVSLAYCLNWTDSRGSMVVFDVTNLQWTENVTIKGLPAEHQDIQYVQGGFVDGNILYLISDVPSSALLTVNLDTRGFLSVHNLGLGHEREGIALYKNDWLLSLGNQGKNSWDRSYHAQIVAIQLSGSPEMDGWKVKSVWLAYGVGIAGFVTAMIAMLMLRRQRNQQKFTSVADSADDQFEEQIQLT